MKGSSAKRPTAPKSTENGSLAKAVKTAPVRPADWYLRASAYWSGNAWMSLPALWCLRVGAQDYAKEIAETAYAQLEQRDPVRRDIDNLARISYVFERVGDGRRSAEALDKARKLLGQENNTSFELNRRGLEYDVGFSSALSSLPFPLAETFLDADAARRDGDEARVSAALKKLDGKIEKALTADTGTLRIAGEYAIMHGIAGNLEKVREILELFKDKDSVQGPNQAFEALYLAGDKQSAHDVAQRELRQRIQELSGKGPPLVVNNPHHVMGSLVDLLEVQWRLGDRTGVIEALDELDSWLNGTSQRAGDTRGWALSMLAHLEVKAGRIDRARAAVLAAENLATQDRGSESSAISWMSVAKVYLALGDTKKAEAAVKRIPERRAKNMGKLALLIARGASEEAAKLVETWPEDSRWSVCEDAGKLMEELVGNGGRV